VYVYTCLRMTTKNLAIREDVYRRLAEAKRQGESFSDTIERVLERRGSILELWGILADSPSLVDIENDMKKMRKTTVVRA
jgi:predicted CopG family antitoxin